MKSNCLLALLVAGAIFSGLTACSEKSTGDKAQLAIRLTDDPADYDAVNIDIRDVQINVTGDDEKGWQSLAGVHTGVYNLLDLVNDQDTLLVQADIPTGRLHQIRLVLGPNNSIVANGIELPLETPGAQQSGLKLNVQQDVSGGILYTILLDFDAGKSVVKTGNGKYILKPVIRTLLSAAGGSIKGVVHPASVLTAIYALQGSDTIATTFTSDNGGYLLKGLPEGTYGLHYWPVDTTYQHSFQPDIPVIVGNVTAVDTVFLQQ
jgi:hypothetical protein